MKENVFKKQNLFLYVFKTLLLSFVLALLITFGVSILCGYKYKIVATGSMTPTLPINSLVVLAPVDYEDLEVGDIITYKGVGDGKYTFTHRVVRRNPNGNVVTKGDANPSEDGEISKDRLVGKVVIHMDSVGYLITYIKKNIMQVAFMIIIVFLTYLIVAE